MKVTATFIAAVALLAAVQASAVVPAPHVSVDSLSDISVPDAPFNRAVDADAALTRAFVQARNEHKLVLIDLGANWCADCRVLAGIMELPELRRFLDAHYVTVNVDVGHFDRNLQIPAHWGITERLQGVPVVLIAAPDGTLVNAGHVAALMDADSMEPQAVADWFARWAM